MSPINPASQSAVRPVKLLIVGGVAGGASAATRARRLSEDAEIILFEKGPDVSFANCGMPYYAGGVIDSREKLVVTTPERLRRRFAIDVRTRHEVLAIDRDSRRVRVRELETGREYEESYDRLVLAPGAVPVTPEVPGIDLPGIFTLRALEDIDHIKAGIDAGLKRAVVVGGGFIGLEFAENLVHRGVATTIVELQQQLLPPLDAEMTTPILASLVRHDVDLRLGDSAVAFEQVGQGLEVCLASGERLPAGMVVVGVGVRPLNTLAVEAGLEIGPRGGVRVDEQMRTSDPAIHAVGDVAEIREAIFGEPAQIPLAGPANRQGRIAADAVFGRESRYRGTQGTSVVGVFEVTAASTGFSEKQLRREGRHYRKVYVHPANHAGYYPGAESMTLKLLFDPQPGPRQGRILGAQAVGGHGVDKQIDVIAIAIQSGLTVYDLEETELAYAPQYGSAKDPVNMAGFVAAGLLRGDHPQADMETVLEPGFAERSQAGEAEIPLDVRTPEEFARGHLPAAINIPVEELRARLGELPRNRRVLCYCQVGYRGYLATRILLQHGFDVANLGGGYKTFRLHCPDEHAAADGRATRQAAAVGR